MCRLNARAEACEVGVCGIRACIAKHSNEVRKYEVNAEARRKKRHNEQQTVYRITCGSASQRQWSDKSSYGIKAPRERMCVVSSDGAFA